MRKKILGLTAAGSIAVTAVINMNIATQESGLSEVSLSNIEALAGGEIIVDTICIQANDFCEEAPVPEDPYWYWTWPFRNWN